MHRREHWRSLHFRPEMELLTCVNSLVHAYALARAAPTPRSIDLKREHEKAERDCLETNCPVHFSSFISEYVAGQASAETPSWVLVFLAIGGLGILLSIFAALIISDIKTNKD